MRRVLVLAAVALLSWAAWTIVAGVAGVLYGVASGTALIGLLLLALRTQRGSKEAHVEEDESAGAPAATARSTRRAARPLPGIRRSRFVRELEEENRLLREELAQRLEELQGANDVSARSQSLYEEALSRLERNLRHHSRERKLLEAELEAILPRGPATPVEAVDAGPSRALST
jgi:predicted RNase H-like nuclease (RuvC/YqgF family)